MILNRATLDAAFTGFNAAFQGGLKGTTAVYWSHVAMKVPSKTAKNLYPWLNQLPDIRKWVGERQLRAIASSKYELPNEDFESTVRVDRNNIADDELGIYAPLFSEIGASTARFPDRIVYGALAAGFASLCYDGQYFFDTDHPVLDANGVAQSVSNFQGGAGAPWVLVDDSRSVKPILLQEREPFRLVRKDSPTDDNAFFNKEFIYGVDGRYAAGYGLWQTAYGSKQTLNYDNFNLAMEAMAALKGDYAVPLGMAARKLIVGPSLRTEALEVVKRERLANGETNINKDAVEVVIVPYL